MPFEGTSNWIVKEHSLIKEKILGKYLKPWFTKLSSKYDILIYIDGFAGAGRLKTEKGDIEDGSPLIAIENAVFALEKHKKTAFYLLFFEKSKDFEELEINIKKKLNECFREKEIPSQLQEKIITKVFNLSFEGAVDVLKKFVNEHDELSHEPLFVFIDPYGLEENLISWIEFFLTAFDKSELLVNLMISAARRNPSSSKTQKLFGENIDVEEVKKKNKANERKRICCRFRD